MPRAATTSRGCAMLAKGGRYVADATNSLAAAAGLAADLRQTLPAPPPVETVPPARKLEPAAARPRLPLPPTVRREQVLWIYAASIAGIHVLALLAFIPYFFSWTGLVVMVLGIHAFGQGITLCYHRLLTHRSFQVPQW